MSIRKIKRIWIPVESNDARSSVIASIWGRKREQCVRKHKYMYVKHIVRYKLAITRTCSRGPRHIPTVIATGIVSDFMGRVFPRCILTRSNPLRVIHIYSYIDCICVVVLKAVVLYEMWHQVTARPVTLPFMATRFSIKGNDYTLSASFICCFVLDAHSLAHVTE